MADQKKWFVRLGSKVHGPFTSRQLKQLADAAKIGPETAIRRGDSGNWVAAHNVKGLFAAEPAALVATTPDPPLPAVAEPSVPALVESHAVPANVPSGVIVEGTSAPGIARVPCPICGEEIAESAVKCRHCNEFLDGRPREQPSTPQIVAAGPVAQPNVNVVVNQQTNVGMAHRRWSPLVAMLLSFLIPGVGQMYKGQVVNGIVWLLVVVVGYFFLIIPGLVLHLFCIVGAGMGDPYR